MNEKGPGKIRNILLLELIGTQLRVLQHTDPGLIGREGIVLDETKGTFLLENNGRRSVVPKNGGRFRFTDLRGESLTIEIDGSDILFRPEDRIKKLDKKENYRKNREP
jgi:ribonuclease P protein subunit POP4